MARNQRLRGEDYITPGMAYGATMGSVNEPYRIVGHDRNGRPLYQGAEVVVRPATPDQGLQELDRRELRDDGRSTVDAGVDAIKPVVGGAALSKLMGGRALAGAAAEGPTALGIVYAVHDLLGRYIGNEDVGRTG